MTVDAIIVIVALFLSALGLTWGLRGRWPLLGLGAGLLLTAGAGVAVYVWPSGGARQAPAAGAAHQPREATLTPSEGERYASSRMCRACHPGAYETWRRTYHRTMTQRATPEAVIPEWDGVVLEDQGRTYRLFRKGEAFWVDMPAFGTDGQRPETRIERPVVLTTGSHQMQIYWIPTPWADVPPTEEERDAYRLHCARCHVPAERQRLVAAPAGALEGLGLQPDELDGLWDLKAHQRAFVGLTDEQRALAVRHLKRSQLTGPLTQFPFSWFVREGRWVHEEYTFLQPPVGESPGEPYGEDWSDRCDQCHTVSPRFDEIAEAAAGGQAEVAELGIACEACHGPGLAHAERHRNPLNRYLGHLSEEASSEPDIVNPSRLSGARSMAVCGQCHGELVYTGDWSDPASPRYQPGDRLELYANVLYYEPDPAQRPAWMKDAMRDEPDLLQSAFWKDGTMRIAGRDLNGIIISPCTTKGEMTCLSCHGMHDHEAPEDLLKPKMSGDEACTQCHPAIAADLSAHTHHPPGSQGSRCYNCHMPHTTFGLLKAIRAHRVDSPDATTSARTGRPTACNLCHLDKPLGDVARSLADWYGHPMPTLTEEDRTVAQSVAHLLRGNAVQRGIMAWHMAWGPAREASDPWWFAPYLAQLVNDPYVAVRFLAIQGLDGLPGFDGFEADFTGSDEHRRAASEEALRRWLAQPLKEPSPALLIGEGGLERSSILQLISVRDEQEISINE